MKSTSVTMLNHSIPSNGLDNKPAKIVGARGAVRNSLRYKVKLGPGHITKLRFFEHHANCSINHSAKLTHTLANIETKTKQKPLESYQISEKHASKNIFIRICLKGRVFIAWNWAENVISLWEKWDRDENRCQMEPAVNNGRMMPEGIKVYKNYWLSRINYHTCTQMQGYKWEIEYRYLVKGILQIPLISKVVLYEKI